jgi:hypothetical protein
MFTCDVRTWPQDDLVIMEHGRGDELESYDDGGLLTAPDDPLVYTHELAAVVRLMASIAAPLACP